MTIRTLSLAAALTLTLAGTALAQVPAGGGSATGNMNNPGSVKSDSDKAMEGRGGSMGTGMAPGTSGGPSTGTAGSAGTGLSGTGGNAATGSGAAPSGK